MRLVQNSVWPEVLVRQGRDGGMENRQWGARVPSQVENWTGHQVVRMLTSGHIGRLE